MSMQVLLGDVFSDLPPVPNGQLLERLPYLSEPQTAQQVGNGGVSRGRAGP